jgi:hypothetical protein
MLSSNSAIHGRQLYAATTMLIVGMKQTLGWAIGVGYGAGLRAANLRTDQRQIEASKQMSNGG